MRQFFKGDKYSREETIRGNTVHGGTGQRGNLNLLVLQQARQILESLQDLTFSLGIQTE